MAGVFGVMVPSEIDFDLRRLFAVNVLLQMVDGFVTWQGLQLGILEGNPLIRAAMEVLGVEAALLLFKAQACGFLVLLRRSVPALLARKVLVAVAVVYALGASVPWTGKFIALLAI